MAALLLLGGCRGESDDQPQDRYGSIALKAVWPGDVDWEASLTQDAYWPLLVAPDIITMRIIITGPDISPAIQKDFLASAGSGLVNDVPLGTNRTVALQALDASNNIDFSGFESSVDITDPVNPTVVGPISMGPTSGVPYVMVTPPADGNINENGGAVDFNLHLNAQPSAGSKVVITVYSPDTTEALLSTIAAPSQVQTLSVEFNDGNWSNPQAVTINGQIDDVMDGNQPLTVQLSIFAGGTTDTTGYADFTPAQVRDVDVTIVDSDTPGVSVSPITVSISEAAGTGSFDVVLNTIPDGDVVITVTSPNIDKARVSSIGSPTPGGTLDLIFPAADWYVAQSVTLTGQDDYVADGNAPVTIAVDVDTVATADTTGYKDLLAADVADVAVTVTDNDAVGVTVTAVTTTFSEAGGIGEYSVVLNSEPTGTVTVNMSTPDNTEALVNGPIGSPGNNGTVTFSTLNWNSSKTVTITGQDDSIVDGSQSFWITMGINGALTGDTTGYKTFGNFNRMVTVTDNESPDIYVATTGNDSNAGTTAAPMVTISGAINYLNSLTITHANPKKVHVAAGTYNVTSGTSHITLAEGISVYGGYNALFASPTSGSSIINDLSTTGGTTTNPNRAVQVPGTVTNATVFDGFQVNGGGGNYSSAMLVQGSPLITANEINGGSGGTRSYGLYISGGSPGVFNNTIVGGVAAAAWTMGMVVINGSPPIFNNTINAGTGGGSATGVYLQSNGNPSIQNNIIFATNSGTSTGVSEQSGATNPRPTSFKNNDLWSLTYVYINVFGGSSNTFNTTQIADLETELNTEVAGTASGNVSLDPVFINLAGGNWQLETASPATVRNSGLMLSTYFTTDKNYVNRGGSNWSMGAYEQP